MVFSDTQKLAGVNGLSKFGPRRGECSTVSFFTERKRKKTWRQSENNWERTVDICRVHQKRRRARCLTCQREETGTDGKVQKVRHRKGLHITILIAACRVKKTYS